MECKELSQQLQCSQKFAFLKVQAKMDNITHKNTLKLLSSPLAPLVHSTFQFVQGTKLTPHRLHSAM